jgi:hypothetical protein
METNKQANCADPLPPEKYHRGCSSTHSKLDETEGKTHVAGWKLILFWSMSLHFTAITTPKSRTLFRLPHIFLKIKFPTSPVFFSLWTTATEVCVSRFVSRFSVEKEFLAFSELMIFYMCTRSLQFHRFPKDDPPIEASACMGKFEARRSNEHVF